MIRDKRLKENTGLNYFYIINLQGSDQSLTFVDSEFKNIFGVVINKIKYLSEGVKKT